MHKLIPTIYFYVVSLIGLVLLIIGLFGLIHYGVGMSAYPKYPLNPFEESRCLNMMPAAPVNAPNAPALTPTGKTDQQMREDCQKTIEDERSHQKADDLEKGLSFTLIGGILFAIHFTFARRKQ